MDRFIRKHGNDIVFGYFSPLCFSVVLFSVMFWYKRRIPDETKYDPHDHKQELISNGIIILLFLTAFVFSTLTGFYYVRGLLILASIMFIVVASMGLVKREGGETGDGKEDEFMESEGLDIALLVVSLMALVSAGVLGGIVWVSIAMTSDPENASANFGDEDDQTDIHLEDQRL